MSVHFAPVFDALPTSSDVHAPVHFVPCAITKMLVISDLIAGYVSHHFSTASQMITAKAPSLTPVFLCISPQDQTVVLRVASIPANVSFASTTSIVCGVSKQSACTIRKTRAVLGVTNA